MAIYVNCGFRCHLICFIGHIPDHQKFPDGTDKFTKKVSIFYQNEAVY